MATQGLVAKSMMLKCNILQWLIFFFDIEAEEI